jgi:glycosyltransferase involved in cell wall biosynthesis
MLVGFEATSVVVGRRSGVGQFTDNLLRAMRQTAQTKGVEFVFYANKFAPKLDETGLSLQEFDIYQKNRVSPRLLWMNTRLPKSIATTKPDLCHFPNYLMPVPNFNAPSIVTMYDMSVYSSPEFHPTKTVLVHQAVMPIAARRASAIITISESARQDILHYLPVPPEKVQVIYAGVAPHFHARHDHEIEEQIRQRYNLNFPFVLTVGTLEPRKNQVRLIQAFAELVKQERLPHHLVVAGSHGWKESPIWETVQKSGIEERLHFLGYVPSQTLPHLYHMATAFAFPSLHEGFGLPVLEAMACGTPVLTSHIAALVELTGSAAYTVDPLSTQEIAAGLYCLLTCSADTEILKQKGLERAKAFAWQTAARQTLRLYKDVYDLSIAAHQFKSYATTHFSADASPARDEQKPMDDLQFTNYKFNFEASPETISGEQMVANPESSTYQPLEKAILLTVAYADIFSFPLTLKELHRYLVGYKATGQEISTVLAESAVLSEKVEQKSGFIFLKGRQNVLDRRQRQLPDVRKGLIKARKWGKRLQMIPFVETAILTGSLAMDSSRHKDDVDFLLLTKPGRLWTCRALVIGLVRIARLFGVELCPNYLLATTPTAMKLTAHNLYTAHELAHARLVFGEAGFQQLLNLNQWLTGYLPNAEFAMPALLPEKNSLFKRSIRRIGEKLLSGKIGDKFEQWEQKRKIAKLSSQQVSSSEVQFNEEVCKGHFEGYAHQTLAKFQQKCSELGLM